jgi:ATPase complex subunit ATP10
LSATGNGTGAKATPLKLLPRPLGVSTPPRWAKLTKEEKIQNFNDTERREHERNVLMKLNSQPYYADIHKIAFHGGKTWIGPERLIMEERSLYFPDLSGKPLADPPPPVDPLLSDDQRREQLILRGPHIPLTGRYFSSFCPFKSGSNLCSTLLN